MLYRISATFRGSETRFYISFRGSKGWNYLTTDMAWQEDAKLATLLPIEDALKWMKMLIKETEAKSLTLERMG